LAKRADAAAKALGGGYELEKVTGLQEIMAFGVFITPALVVDGQVKVTGQVPDVEEIKKMIA
jgi:protein-disulfide isomerase